MKIKQILKFLFIGKRRKVGVLENKQYLPEINIKALSSFIFDKVEVEDYIRLYSYIKSLEIQGLCRQNENDLITFDFGDEFFLNSFYTMYLMEIFNILNHRNNYYVKDRGVILYGLYTVLTKIPNHISFFENLWFVFTYDLIKKEYIAYSIDRKTREPELENGYQRYNLDINPILWLENNESIGTWIKPTHLFEFNQHILKRKMKI